ncbi:ATP-dependent (S)-NAD(P)H-hydrate dehydratase-like isoform X2 [Daphnia pulicaria]|nr:ATP-dependent (S)-NAD(P)H-hydrate dehydratase-like isoform X2 [Daphnia pulicaria]
MSKSMQILSKELLLLEMKKSIPILSSSLHKGESGRIGVIGGSLEYTGAPYFAAMAALRVGCDLVHVFCMKEAAPVIKSYSPELIVHPLLDSPNAQQAISEWLPRIHALIIGPGLGRDAGVFKILGPIINHAKELKIPLVIDADGLFYINSNHQIIHNCTNVILTPNVIEFTRLYKAVMGISIDPSQPVLVEDVAALAKRLGNVTILQKAEKDITSNGIDVNICEKMGSPRRCGGQGDLLCGFLATFLYWKTHDKYTHEVTLSAAAAATHLSRMISRKAFEIHGRGTLASDMIPYIPECFRSLFNQE